MSLVLDAVHDVDAGAKLTLIAMADTANAGDAGRTWQAVGTIASRTCRHERQIRMDLRALESADWIKAQGTGMGGRGRATTYQLNIDKMLAALNPKKAAAHCRVLKIKPGSTVPPIQTVNPAVNVPKPGSPAHKTRQSTAPEPELKAFEPESSEPASGRTREGDEAARTALAKAKGLGDRFKVNGHGNRNEAPEAPMVDDATRDRLEAEKRRMLAPFAGEWFATEAGFADRAIALGCSIQSGETIVAWRARVWTAHKAAAASPKR